MASTNKPSRAAEGQTKTVFVRRLERLMRLRRDYLDDLNPLGLRLLDRALYATYRDPGLGRGRSSGLVRSNWQGLRAES